MTTIQESRQSTLSESALDDPKSLSGVEYFAARRAMWLTPSAGPRNPATPRSLTPEARQRLHALADQILAGDDEDERLWKSSGLMTVWRGIVEGSRLKQTIPLGLLVKILRAGWIRDGTWPRHLQPTQSDDDLVTTKSSSAKAGC
ncbi:hypothetical protein PUNSTDRAFT_119749 [Punctularia strigosozonata HHB-11173 SS5]|uniref:uncharacterized protein n=1 Tax=Punctularia strigosozonata (strain HHB-11173) TaxID=741275 RepID=UPI0004416FD7|nr:uncharacterized protein PUNSTDRAFT_119749 [Punctularia strigosozonata HHB-11173 SS5]EIN10907.1 hypothetical protein PUNSTDRAFT_119749 [Punctularia strigosozonata HHB-11173 SS5]